MIADRIRYRIWRNRRALPALLGLAMLNVLVASCSAVEQQDRWVYSCPDGYRFDVRFSANGESAELSSVRPSGYASDSPTETVRLTREVSASGARYSDGTTVLWTKGIMAMIQVNSEVVHRDCQGDSDPVTRME